MGLTTGIGMACPVTTPGFTEYANPNICQQFILKEVNCADAKIEDYKCFSGQQQPKLTILA
ncbi:hypothetical protein GQ42DRAFT_163353 [Ramicandelaber brevisporus]|nr:hypothetical protein GQ42DRAFT_163353 [Ramicandelaber brevisporus]